MRISMLAALIVAAPVTAQEIAPIEGTTWAENLCEGDDCDAYLPILKKTVRFENTSGRRKWGAALGGLAGVLIGEEVAGAPGAVLLGAYGAASGYDYIDSKQWEAKAKAYNQEWQRGGDIYYDPSHRLPLKAHWMLAGAATVSARPGNK